MDEVEIKVLRTESLSMQPEQNEQIPTLDELVRRIVREEITAARERDEAEKRQERLALLDARLARASKHREESSSG